MGWRAEWLKRASPEAIAEYRLKERTRVRKWEKDNPGKVKARKRSPEKVKVYTARWRTKNKGYRSANDLAKAATNRDETKRKRAARKIVSYQKRLVRNKAWQEANQERVREYKAAWYEANKWQILQSAVERYPQTRARLRERRVTDIQFAIASRLRARIQKAFRVCGVQRSIRLAELIGCPLDQFRQHIERQFAKEMSWGNRAKWHLDHIRPVASFNLSDPEQQRACFHFTNIRPLWRRENQQKSSRVQLLL